jgi:hypothetical protein
MHKSDKIKKNLITPRDAFLETPLNRYLSCCSTVASLAHYLRIFKARISEIVFNTLTTFLEYFLW